MNRQSFFTFQALVFGLVAAALTTVYITQPVLPVLQQEFGVSPSQASYTVSAVILGIALANLPFGMLADRFPVQRLILVGGAVVAACGFFCAATSSLALLVGARFVQGLFVPALTTCLAAYLSTNLPLERLNVAMGSYVSATVAGGLGGRLLGGFIHPPLHWRYAFITASLLVVAATLAAVRWLPAGKLAAERQPEADGFLALVAQPGLRRAFQVAFGGFFVFSSIFNYLPFYLHRPPFNASTEFITLLYLTYIVGIFIGPVAGQLSNRIGNGSTMVLGSLVFALAIVLTLIKSIFAIVARPGAGLRRFLLHSCRGRRLPQPQPDREPRPGQLPLRPGVLPGRGRGHHPERLCLRAGGLARGGRPGPHDADGTPGYGFAGDAAAGGAGPAPGKVEPRRLISDNRQDSRWSGGEPPTGVELR